jgi:hypothetical protein
VIDRGFSDSVAEMHRVLARSAAESTDALLRFGRLVRTGGDVYIDAESRTCRLCGGTIELGCCTRCGVPEETR